MASMPAPTSAPADRPRPGLRERKKTKTREAIRAATHALIKEQGYEATTVEQIAERAEVSPSTVLRYFAAKEDIVLADEHDPLLLDELRARPVGEPWMDSVRHVTRLATDALMAEDPDVVRMRARLAVEVPAVRSRVAESMAERGRLLRAVLAERTGLDADSVEVRVCARSLVGGLMEATLAWAENGFEDDLRTLLDRALDVLEHGLSPRNP